MRRLVSVSVLLGVLIAGWAVRAWAAGGPSPEAVAKARDALDNAISTARAALSSVQRDEALGCVAPVVARLDANEASALLREIADDHRRNETMLNIVEQVAKGDVSKALEVARSVSDSSYRDPALSVVAQVAAWTDPRRAMEIAKGIERDYNRDQALYEISGGAAWRDPELALRAALGVRGEGQHTMGLYEMIIELGLAGSNRADIALRAAWAIEGYEDPEVTAPALAECAAMWAKTDAKRSRLMAAEALAQARTVEATPSRGRTFARIASALAKANPQRAQEAADLAADLATDTWLASDVIDEVQDPYPEVALRVARRTRDGAEKVQLLNSLAWCFRKRSPPRARALAQEALKAFESLSPEQMQKPGPAASVAGALAATDPDAALSVVWRVQDAKERTRLIGYVASQAAATLPERALKIAQGIQDANGRDETMCNLAVTFAKTNVDRALAAARAIESPYWRARALAEVAWEITFPGEPEIEEYYDKISIWGRRQVRRERESAGGGAGEAR